MLNIDSEDEGYLLVSCAGGVAVTVHVPVQREQIEGIPVTLTVGGLQGGHSGVEIDKGRGNANQILGRVLYELGQSFSYQICEVSGGLKDNAIPRLAEAKLLFAPSAKNKIAEFKTSVKELSQILAKEYKQKDPAVELVVETGDGVCTMPVMAAGTAEKVVTTLVCLPGGIQRMSADVEGLVQTSLNLGILKTEEDEVSFSFAVRSSVETEKKELVSRISCLVAALGGTVSCMGEYPAWEYRQDSPLRDRMVEVFEEQYGRKPVVQAIHAGVECGLFAGKLPGLDCVSYGPDMKDIHTPNESMDVESVRRTWEYTREVLKRLR